MWILFEPDSATRRARLSYRWFGGRINGRLPELGDHVTKHPITKRERRDHRLLKAKQFTDVGSTAELVKLMFGEVPATETWDGWPSQGE